MWTGVHGLFKMKCPLQKGPCGGHAAFGTIPVLYTNFITCFQFGGSYRSKSKTNRNVLDLPGSSKSAIHGANAISGLDRPVANTNSNRNRLSLPKFTVFPKCGTCIDLQLQKFLSNQFLKPHELINLGAF